MDRPLLIRFYYFPDFLPSIYKGSQGSSHSPLKGEVANFPVGREVSRERAGKLGKYPGKYPGKSGRYPAHFDPAERG
jgi:hypothetical protein